MKQLFILFFALFLMTDGMAQELRAQVRVSTPNLQSTDPAIFKDLENRMADFLNNTAFTDEYYEEHEKIKVSFQLTIKDELGPELFTGELTIQSSRPVYASQYESVLVNYLDSDVKFVYSPGTILQFQPDGYHNNLSSLFSYWVMMVIGYDYDSFEEEGGSPYFKIAESIAASIPATEADEYLGWRPSDSNKNRNRYWLAENLLNPKVSNFRKAQYRYHRYGLDVMHEQSSAGQTTMLNALQVVSETRDAYPDNMVVQLFTVSKSDEIIEVMARASRTQQRETATIMNRLDPSRRSQFAKLQ